MDDSLLSHDAYLMAECLKAPSRRGSQSITPVDGFRRNTVFSGLIWIISTFIILQVIAAGILLLIDSNPTAATNRLAALLVTIFADCLALIAIPVWLLGGYRPALRALGFRKLERKVVGWGIAGLALSYLALGIYVGVVTLSGIDALMPISAIDKKSIYENIHLVVLTGIVVVLVAPLAEEVFFRGFLVGGIMRRWNLWSAVVLSSLFFAAIHFDVGSLIPFAIIGGIFTFIYIRSRNLLSSIIAHTLFNTIGFFGLIVERGIG